MISKKLYRAICNQKMLKVIDFLSKDGRDWKKDEIATKSHVSSTLVYRMIRMGVLEKMRGGEYQIHSTFNNDNKNI